MTKLQDTALLVARILMPILFIVAGWGKINGYTATAGYMTSMGVPSFFLPLTILLEFGGGLAILFGFFTRTTALITAIFTILTALIFHTDFCTGREPDDVHEKPVHRWRFLRSVCFRPGRIQHRPSDQEKLVITAPAPGRCNPGYNSIRQ